GIPAVVIFDPLGPVLLGVDPDDLAAIARLAIFRCTLDDEAGLFAAWLVAQPFVPVALVFLRENVLVGELTADERSGLVARRDSLGPAERRQEQPLLVVAGKMGEAQQRGACDVARPVELDQRLVAA